jgi:predicted small metal-binding protein
MTHKLLKCSDFGGDCPVEFRGPTVEDVLEQAKKHGMEAHGQTAEHVNSQEVMQTAATKTRDEDAS